MQTRNTQWILMAVAAFGYLPAVVNGADDAARIDQRFAVETVTETPDFRQHVVPLLGKLGCNGRACHGSFQGQGGLRLSLFGYDFKADHDALTQGEKPRISMKAVADSLMLQKPLQVVPHEGGTRLKEATWQHRVLTRWIEAGAKSIGETTPEFVRLEITPEEIIAAKRGEQFVLKAVAVWSNGAREDVTPLCRFQTNNDQVATVDETGLVTSAGPGDSHVVVTYDNGVVPVPVLQPVSDKFGPNYPAVPTPTKIDELVVQKLRKLGMTQSELCTDAEFLRRVSLDMIGTLPTAAEVEAFLADTTADKRAKKIDELLERPAYAAWWATKFADWTGNNAGKLNNKQPTDVSAMSTDWYEWLRTRIEKNVAYDQIAEGIILAVSRQEGETYTQYCERMSGYYHKEPKGSFADQPSMSHYWIRQEFLKPEERALGFAYTFLGLRIQCAQCHKHPFDQWTKDDFDRFKEFFSRATYNIQPKLKDEERAIYEKIGLETKDLKGNDLRNALRKKLADGEVVPFQELYVPTPRNNNVARDRKNKNNKRPQVVAGRTAKILGGEEVKIEDLDDPREALMDWLRDDANPYFAKAIVNRIWAAYFNVGIVEPVDDLSLANPPSNEALLDYLATQFRERHYDMKWLHRTIANSRTYQLSWQPNATNEFDERNFARSVPRRLPAEVAYDSLQLATMSDFEAVKWQTSVNGRAIGNTVVNSRQNGKGQSNYALSIFGRSVRDTNCECDRSSESSLLQTVFLQNDSEVLTMIGGKGRWVDQVLKRGEPERDAKQAGADVKARQARRIDQADVAQLKKRLAAAKEKGNKARVEAIKKEIAEREKNRPDETPEKPAPAAAVVSVADYDTSAIIRQAYLRSLSRYPTEAEASRAARYYEETGDVARGTKDLLWALINTKEFVVNH